MLTGRSLLLALGLTLALVGCGLPVHTDGLAREPVLLLPARDVVQDGKPHERGAESGERLRAAVQSGLRSRDWEVVSIGPEGFDPNVEVSEQDALDAGNSAGTTYVLKLVLGEFRDAAPMTFRSDYASLEKAELFHCESGVAVWFLKKPVRLEKTNLGGYQDLVYHLGERVADSIDDSVVE